jgi:hypothetical protein
MGKCVISSISYVRIWIRGIGHKILSTININ